VSQAPLFENLILNTVARQNWREVKEFWKDSDASSKFGSRVKF
jgi:hypothetical protein